METLKELIGFLDRYKVRQIEVLTNNPTKSDKQETRYFECYVGMREGRWANEEEVARHFGLELDSKAYNRFKNEVKKRLLNSVLFVDTSLPEFSDYARAAITLSQQWAVAKTLVSRGLNQLFIELSFKLLDGAIKYEFLPEIVEISRLLKARLAHYPQYVRDYQRASAIFEQYYPAFLAEVRIRNAYESVIHPLSLKKGLPSEVGQQVGELIRELQPLADAFNYLIPNFTFRLLQIFAATYNKNWPEAIRLADEALDFVETKTFVHRMFRLSMLHQKANCQVMTGQFEAAEITLKEALPLSEEGTTNWFKTQEVLLVNALYAEDYSRAWNLWKDNSRHPRYFVMPALDQETWRLYQGYLFLLVKLGKLDVSPREKGEIEKFRLSSWLNDLPLHSQDKRGANIPLLILQALFLLHADRLDEFDNRVEAMRKYRQRNLDHPTEHLRTDCFIRLFELVPKHGYQPEAIARAAEPWLERIQQESIDLLNGAYEVEIVPYERQWQWVMEVLARVPAAG